MTDTETRKAPKCRLFQWLHDFPEWKSAGSFEDQYRKG